MKKLIITIFLLIPAVLFGQRTFNDGLMIGDSVAGSNIRTLDSLTSRYEGAYALYSLGRDSVLLRQASVFNILDYGAIDNDGNPDQDAIQTAVDAAYINGGTVWIPPGRWDITDSVHLKSSEAFEHKVTIKCEAGAIFYFASGYTGSMWKSGGAALAGLTIDGGSYYATGASKDGVNFLNLLSNDTGNGVLDCTFKNMHFYFGNYGINLVTTSTGWINSNTFENIYMDGPISAIRTRQGAGTGGLDANFFIDIDVQAGANTLFGIDSLSGDQNHIVNLTLWDWAVTGALASTCVIVSGAERNMIDGLWITHKNYVDNGYHNRVISSGALVSPIYDSLIIQDTQYPATKADRLLIQHSAAGGTIANPAGDVGIRLKPRADEGTYLENQSVQIVARQSAQENYASYLVFQTHGTAQSASYVDAMVIDPVGNVEIVGTVSGSSVFTLDTDPTVVLDASDCQNKTRFNNDAGAVDYTLPAATAGLVIMFYDIAGGVITVDPVDGTDTIYLNGESVGAGNAIDSPGAVGDFICLMAIDATRWVTIGKSGIWVDGGTD